MPRFYIALPDSSEHTDVVLVGPFLSRESAVAHVATRPTDWLVFETPDGKEPRTSVRTPDETEEFRETCTIYGASRCPTDRAFLEEFCRQHGWTDAEDIVHLARVSYGAREFVVLQSQDGSVEVYVYDNDSHDSWTLAAPRVIA